MLPGSPAQVLQAAAMGGTVPRPLLAPLCSAIAGELQGLTPEEFLQDVTKLSNSVRDLARSLNVDVAVAEFGTLWDVEALGVSLAWSGGFPPVPQEKLPAATAPDFAGNGRGPVVTEAVRRLQALLGDGVMVAAGVTGPVRLSRLSEGDLSPTEAAELLVLPAVRPLCEAGAKLVWIVEEPEPPSDPESLAAAMLPVWQSIQFYQGLGVLHLAEVADGWKPMIATGGPYLPCFDPDQSPELAAYVRGTQDTYGLALPPGPPGEAAGELARTGRCAILTNNAELAGTVSARDLRKVVEALRGASE
jgi:hypothetical protein